MHYNFWTFLKRFINTSGNIKESPALWTFAGGLMSCLTIYTICQGEVNMSRSSISPIMVRYAEHPIEYILIMLLFLVFVGWLFFRAYQCWLNSTE